MMNNQGGAVRVSDLRVQRGGRDVLRGLSFEVPTGQVTGLLGPSGCGKTTLMRALVGVQSRVQGEIEVLGERPGASTLRRRMGYVTQDPSVYGDLTVRQNMQFFASVLGAGRAAVDRAIEYVDLTDHADALVANLSGGQSSRASLAVALLGSPEVLVLDEPTVGLDPVLRRDLWNLFHRLADEDGVTLLVSSHVMDEADRCQRLLLMREGLLLADGTPQGLRDQTGAHDIEGAFLTLVDEARGVAS